MNEQGERIEWEVGDIHLPLQGLVLRQVQSLGNDGVSAPVGPAILQQDPDVTRPQHRLLDGHFEAGQSGLCMSSILVDLVRNFADPEKRNGTELRRGESTGRRATPSRLHT